MSKEEKLLNRLLSIMGSSEFLVILNGVPKRYNNSYVYARVQRDPKKEDKVTFYTKFSSGGKKFVDMNKNIGEAVIKDVFDSKLYGLDFSQWLEGKDLIGNVAVNNGLRLLFLESPMYTIVRNNLPNRDNLNIKFGPTVEGKELTPIELSYILDQFRVNGFISLLELERSGVARRIASNVPKFYRSSEAFFMASIREPNLFNPFFDDKVIYSTIKDRDLMEQIREKSVYKESIKTHISYLSNYQASRGLGLPILLPFDYRIFVSLLAGLVMDPDVLPDFIPNKYKTVLRLNTNTDEFPLIISEQEYENSSEYKKSHYTRSNTLNTFLMRNFDFYRRRGLTDLNKLISVMTDLVLL